MRWPDRASRPHSSPALQRGDVRYATGLSRGVRAHGDRAIRAATGGVVGPSYFGSGNNYANCATVGSIAGEAAARAAHHR